MAAACAMCGAPIEHGILCSRCDRPRRVKLPTAETAAAVHAPSATVAVAVETFPKSPVVPFPVESVTPAITSVAHVLVAAAVPAIVLGPDRTVKFMTEELKKLFGLTASDPNALKRIEERGAITVGALSVAESRTLQLDGRSMHFSQVPLTGGAGGAVLIFRPIEISDVHSSFASFIRETVLHPLRSFRESMRSSRGEEAEAVLRDGVALLDQVLSSLQMAPGVEELPPASHVPKVTEVIQSAVGRCAPFAELSGIELQTSVPDFEERFRDHDQLADALGVLLDNSMHYVRPGGQIVAGVRSMEHKGKPILLFFVMDNGPLVPEHLRRLIFEPGFVWNTAALERSGGNLSKVREFAMAHGGSVWVESKTGKACTFFLRVNPDARR